MKKTDFMCNKMRKMFFAVLLSACSMFTLFADDSEDIKNMILQSLKDAVESKWDRAFSCYAEDCKFVDSDGKVFSLKLQKELILMIDGSHPYELLIFTYKEENNGEAPTPAEKYQLKKLSQTPEFQAEYKKICNFAVKKSKEYFSLNLKTIKFRNVKIEGAAATITYDSDSFKDFESDEIVSEITVCKLRKINGSWKIYEEITKKK